MYGCNASTRRFLTSTRGAEPKPNALPPIDRYEALREEVSSRETGKNPAVSHNIQKNPMKLFAEAALGNTADNTGRSGFLKYGASVLRFYCYWDDSTSLYGDVQLFKLHYFLCDNTIEILAVHSPNSGRDRFPLLLKRTKLPKPGGEFYRWNDLYVGAEVNIYSRIVKLIDADRATRAFYLREGGIELGQRILPPVVTDALPTASPEACDDSSPENLQKARPHGKLTVGSTIMRFRAEFAKPKPEDVGRQFLVCYDLADDTVKVREPPRRNAGIVGGKFIAKIKVSEGPTPPLVGTCLKASGHLFRILDADEATLKYMESHPVRFPLSNFETVRSLFSQLAAEKFPDPENRRAALASLLGPKSKLGFGDFEAFLANFVPPVDKNGPPKHAAITFWRAAGKDGTLPVDTLLQLAD